jgi:phosphohistidine phosphatase
MRRLVLVRHSKAEQGGMADIDRELSSRGLHDAAAIGAFLRDHDIVPDRVVVSPATRTRQTWSQIAGALSGSANASYDERIYDGGADDLVAIVKESPAVATTVLLVGHNPTVHAAAYGIDDGEGDPDARRWLRSEFPTSALAIFEIDGEWHEVGPATGLLVAASAPRG